MSRSASCILSGFTLTVGLAVLYVVLPIAQQTARGFGAAALAPRSSWPAPVAQGALPTRGDDPPVLTLSIDDHVLQATTLECGESVTYTLTFTNIGDSPATGITLTVATPRYTAIVSDSLTRWDCSDDAKPTPLCVQQLQLLSPTSSSHAVFVVGVDADLPEDVDSILLEASVVAGNVVCGECGYASLETAVKCFSGQGDQLKLYLPAVARR